MSTTQNASARRETGTGDREQEATDLPASRNRRPRRATVTCYGCGGQGHYRSQCLYTQDSRPVEVSPHVAMAANRHIKGQSGLYLRMKIGKKWCLALLDTGSEITLIPTSWVKGTNWRVSNQQLQAANGTEIVDKGETTVTAHLRELSIPYPPNS